MTTDSAQSRCLYYRHTCHLPATVDPATGAINVRVGLVWAIEMPSHLGQLVKIDLDRRRQGGGPIVCHPRRATWTFLTRSQVPAGILTHEAPLWSNHRIVILQSGAQVALPSPQGRGIFYRGWINATQSPYRPSGLAVLNSVRSVLFTTKRSPATTTYPPVRSHS
ncbi:DNA-directed RNA polymerase subunit beta [Nocardia sp. NPDC057353]|uniref:DNA-directed RNA polymerase subunit beta n=1 Tax=Nocardia sp. NPDC057353 TaxID=3346104 RepID=UPI00363BD911